MRFNCYITKKKSVSELAQFVFINLNWIKLAYRWILDENQLKPVSLGDVPKGTQPRIDINNLQNSIVA